MGRKRPPRIPYTRRVDDVTRDEREEAYAYVLAFADAGATAQGIGRAAGLAPKTVECIIRGVHRSLGRRAYESICRLYEREFIHEE